MFLPRRLRQWLARRRFLRHAQAATRIAAWHRGLTERWEDKPDLRTVERLILAARKEHNMRLLKDAGTVWRKMQKTPGRIDPEE